MSLLKKGIFYFKDFIFQTTIFYLVMLMPISKLFGWENGSFEFYEINYSRIHSSLPKLISIPYFFVLFYLGSIIYSFIPILVNVIIYNIKNNNYIILKITMMVAFNTLYLMVWMKLYTVSIYKDLAFPIFITLIAYIVWNKIKEKRTL